MSTTLSEKTFKNYLLALSIIFIICFILTSYFFIIHNKEHRLLFLLTPPLFLFLFILGKTASSGIRNNNIFSDLLIFSFLAIAIYSLVRIIISWSNSQVDQDYLIFFAASTLLFIISLILWRKSIISRFRLKSLSPTEALAYRALAEVVIEDYKAEGYSFDTIVGDFDKYLSSINSTQKQNAQMVYFAVQYLPIIFLNPPLTWMGVRRKKRIHSKKVL